MLNLVDFISGSQRWAFHLIAKPQTYVLNDAATTAALAAFVRGLKSEDLFAAALQQDVVGVIDAAAFAVAFPARVNPARYDRLRVGTISYAVEAWRGSPNDHEPVFYKLLLRGGAQ